MVSQPVKKFSVFYGTQKFIAMDEEILKVFNIGSP
jgi:hypothetical protein